MPNFRRHYIPDALVFITCVTNQRKHYLEGLQNIQIFWETLRHVQAIHPFQLFAYVILPDHFHWIMKMPDGQPNFSSVMHSIKRNFTWNLKKAHGIEDSFTLWQSRFWDHVIRDGNDLERHVDYIHWNPVKHQLVQEPDQWEHSTLRFWIEKGYYPSSWNAMAAGNVHFPVVEDVSADTSERGGLETRPTKR